ncbi:hypothetical protein BD626DRAFT_514291 [Schizophyllum amplum]|uniref:Uncharacterized protein n=1 Tax=Schizophyllum amplum TaxID=97359 RepID=A0A550BYC9_9AGAR|nr:hypothetical protein BD626DRAFT_514291 [Auriculariopsis ampla]
MNAANMDTSDDTMSVNSESTSSGSAYVRQEVPYVNVDSVSPPWLDTEPIRLPSPSTPPRPLKRGRDAEDSVDDSDNETRMACKRLRLDEPTEVMPPRLGRMNSPELPTDVATLKEMLRQAYTVNDSLLATSGATDHLATACSYWEAARMADRLRDLALDRAEKAERERNAAIARARQAEVDRYKSNQEAVAQHYVVQDLKKELEYSRERADDNRREMNRVNEQLADADEELEEAKEELRKMDDLLDASEEIEAELQRKLAEEQHDHDVTRGLLAAARENADDLSIRLKDALFAFDMERKTVANFKHDMLDMRHQLDAAMEDDCNSSHDSEHSRSSADITISALLN